MLTYARIAGGFVAEVIEIPEDGPTIAERYHPDIVATLAEVPAGLAVEQGWSWDGATFAPPPEPEPVPPTIPDITRRQLRHWLLAQGITDTTVRGAINALPAEVRAGALIDWEDSTVFQRQHPLVVGLGTALGFTEEEMDAGFIQAVDI